MTLTPKEQRVLKETHLRNLKRKYVKLINHADCINQAIELKSEIDSLEKELIL